MAIFLVLFLLNLATILLMNMDVFPGSYSFVRFFHFDREHNVPTLFTIFLILQASVVCIMISRSNVLDQRYWLALSIIFAFLALDEFVSIHERFVDPVRNALSTSGFFHFAWIIPGGIFVLILGIVFLGWLLRLPSQTRRGLILSALIYLSWVLFLEGLEGIRAGQFGQDDLVYILIATVEESLEMIGFIVFTYFAVKFLLAASRNNRVAITIVDD